MNTLTTERPIEQQAIGQIAVDLPGATAIFRRLKLDFCCGGQVSLGEACERKGLDTARVVAELAGLRRDDTAPETPDANALIDHILTRYHAVHREQLPELVRMARRVEAVHRDHPDAPHGLAEHLEIMTADPEALAGQVRNAGAIFLGSHTPEAIGDYVGGSNHVLPTARSARFSSGLGVLDFMKRTSLLKCGPDQLRALGPAAMTLGKAEGLDAHARSVGLRLNLP